MVGVSECFAGNGPGVIPAHLVLIDQHAQQFWNRDCWMGIVQLNNFVIRQFVQFTPRQMMATQNIRYRAGTLEVLLHQAQLFTGSMVVVWIENFGQFFCVDALLFGTQEITIVKFSQIKRMRMRRLPQTQRLRHAITIADNGEIPRLTGNGKLRLPASVFRHFTANPYLHIQCFVVAEPRVVTAMPVIRRFNLFAIDKRLAEQTILIVQTVTRRRLTDSCH